MIQVHHWRHTDCCPPWHHYLRPQRHNHAPAQFEGRQPSDSSPNSATSGTATSGRGRSFKGEARVLSELCWPVRRPSLRDVSVGSIRLPPDLGGDQGLPRHALIIVVVVFVVVGGGGSVGRVNGLVVVISVIVIVATVVVAVAVVRQILAIGCNRGLRRPPETGTAATPTANPQADAGVPPSSVVWNVLSRLWSLPDALNTIMPPYFPMMLPPPTSPPTLPPELLSLKGPREQREVTPAIPYPPATVTVIDQSPPAMGTVLDQSCPATVAVIE